MHNWSWVSFSVLPSRPSVARIYLCFTIFLFRSSAFGFPPRLSLYLLYFIKYTCLYMPVSPDGLLIDSKCTGLTKENEGGEQSEWRRQ